ncbi:MAG: hypothetical protein MI866_19650 [Bacteroidales bacterium]|nr:hypothetical protein [Bacteroidales bacterium]
MRIAYPFMKQISTILLLFVVQSFVSIIQCQKYNAQILPGTDSNTYCYTSSADGQELYYINNNTLTRFSLINNKALKQIDIKVETPVIKVIIESDPNTILLGTKSGKLMAISKESGELLYEKNYESGSINALALTNDGLAILCGCENGMIYKQSLEEINEMSEFYQHDEAITSIEISNEKQLIAISSGDGTISLFRSQTHEWIDRLYVGKEWVRQVSINSSKDRLLCVGDDGNLYEWNINNIDKARLINQSKLSKNWLLSLDIGHDGKIECFGGLDHFLRVRTQFGSYEIKLKGPVLKAEFINPDAPEVYIACCILGKGIQIIPVKEMKFKPIHN